MSELLNKAENLIKPIIDKSLSARFLMALAFSFTYCLVIIACTIALFKKLLTIETYIALLASFVLVVREITDSYFKRDRSKENGAPK